MSLVKLLRTAGVPAVGPLYNFLHKVADTVDNLIAAVSSSTYPEIIDVVNSTESPMPQGSLVSIAPPGPYTVVLSAVDTSQVPLGVLIADTPAGGPGKVASTGERLVRLEPGLGPFTVGQAITLSVNFDGVGYNEPNVGPPAVPALVGVLIDASMYSDPSPLVLVRLNTLGRGQPIP